MKKIIGNNKILTTIYEDTLWRIVKAESVISGEQIWFKILSERLLSHSEIVRDFHQSARLATNLIHSNILPIYDHDSEDSWS